jgi:hypothetical protein
MGVSLQARWAQAAFSYVILSWKCSGQHQDVIFRGVSITVFC